MASRPLLVFSSVAVGTTTAIAVLCAAMGWTVESPAWAALAPIAMWAPALGRLVATRTIDRGSTSTLSLRRWGVTGARVVLVPLAIPLAIYGVGYAIAWSWGFAHWSPGGGRWTTGPQIAANLVINLSILGVFGTFTAMGEEIGWRGYLQPRLDAAGVRASVVVWARESYMGGASGPRSSCTAFTTRSLSGCSRSSSRWRKTRFGCKEREDFSRRRATS